MDTINNPGQRGNFNSLLHKLIQYTNKSNATLKVINSEWGTREIEIEQWHDVGTHTAKITLFIHHDPEHNSYTLVMRDINDEDNIAHIDLFDAEWTYIFITNIIAGSPR